MQFETHKMFKLRVIGYPNLINRLKKPIIDEEDVH